jgi:hypothetical protein
MQDWQDALAVDSAGTYYSFWVHSQNQETFDNAIDRWLLVGSRENDLNW